MLTRISMFVLIYNYFISSGILSFLSFLLLLIYYYHASCMFLTIRCIAKYPRLCPCVNIFALPILSTLLSRFLFLFLSLVTRTWRSDVTLPHDGAVLYRTVTSKQQARYTYVTSVCFSRAICLSGDDTLSMENKRSLNKRIFWKNRSIFATLLSIISLSLILCVIYTYVWSIARMIMPGIRKEIKTRPTYRLLTVNKVV